MFDVEGDSMGSWVPAPADFHLPADGHGKIVAEADPFPRCVEVVTDRCWTEADSLGWHKSYEDLLKRVLRGEATDGDYLNWVSSKMLLVAGEICEAQEELRNGRDVKEIYYRDVDGNCGPVGHTYDEQVFEEIDGVPIPQLKPEGWLVEMADAFIRIGDLVGTVAGAEGVFFGPVVEAKLQYNATRGVMHGGKKF
jgi:hypothetical protein